MTPADVLEAAADLIVQNGRWRGESPKGGKQCPVTAIGWRGSVLNDAELAAVDALYAQVGPITDWNDQEPDDTVVFDTMRHVAAQLRETDR